MEQTDTGRANIEVAGTSIVIEYADCDEEDDGRTGARIFACYKASEEPEVRRIVRDTAGEARWKLESIIDFTSKQPRWDGKP